jgi:hypothetical protein
MKNFRIILIFFFLLILSEKLFSQVRSNEELKVTEIKKNKNWFEIYALGENGKFKLITNCLIFSNIEVSVNNNYCFNLTEAENDFYLRGIRILNSSYCFSIDLDVDICAEPKNGIYQLFYINDLCE